MALLLICADDFSPAMAIPDKSFSFSILKLFSVY
jgi:hypothetical protein